MGELRGKARNCNSVDLEAAPKIMAHNGMRTMQPALYGSTKIKIQNKQNSLLQINVMA